MPPDYWYVTASSGTHHFGRDRPIHGQENKQAGPAFEAGPAVC